MRLDGRKIIVPTPDPLNKAISLFLGYGESSAPHHDATRLVQEFGPAGAAVLEAKVQAILDELANIPVDWSKHTLLSAEQEVLAQMHARHPDLSKVALDALGWDFTFFWR